MRDKKPARVAASLTIVGALVFLFVHFFPFTPRPNAHVQEALGQVLGEETSRLLGSGGRVLVFARDTRKFESPATEMQLRGFDREQQRAGRRAAVIRRIKVDPLRPLAVPPGDFLELLRKTSENDVVVSFMGPPALSDVQMAQLGSKRARVAALCAGSMPSQVDLRRLFTNDLLHAAIISRREAAVTALRPDTPRGWFDLFYLLVTTNSLAELPAAATANR